VLQAQSPEPPPQQVATGAPSGGAASAAEEQVVQAEDRRRQVVVVSSEPPHQRQLALESRESSAESLFTDPLTSPVAAAAATLAPLHGDLSVASSYHSDAGEAMLVGKHPAAEEQPPSVAATPEEEEDDDEDDVPPPSSPGQDLLSEILNYSSDLMNKSFASVGNVAEEAAGLPVRTASGGAFTLIRHKKVELTPLDTAELVGAENGQGGSLNYGEFWLMF